ncbi:MAG: hypothetical protein HFI90_01190 [Clostridia bacterium]|nr:hypothetical protein [Clostridia bacterium]
MFYQKHFPYMKTYEDGNGALLYTIYYEDGQIVTFKEMTPCAEIINFCDLDMTEYISILDDFKQTEYSEERYDDLCKMAWDIVDWLKDKHRCSYFFTSYGLSDILCHPITSEMSIDESFMSNLKRQHITDAQKHLEEVITIHEIFIYGLKICLDKENMPARHVSEKLMDFFNRYPQFMTFTLPTGYALYKTDEEEHLYMTEQDGDKLSVISYVIIERLSEMFYYEFMRIMQNGRQIKRCKNCGKYFVLMDNRKREYCDRVFKDGKRCSEIGHTNTYKNSLGDEQSPLKIAQTLYNKLYSRMDRARSKLPDELTDKDMTEEEFAAWSDLYSSARTDYKSGRISGREFIRLIWRD